MVTDGTTDVDGYREVETFSPGGQPTVAASDDVVIFGSAEGRLDVVGRSDRTRIQTDGPVEDVAVDNYVFALTDGRVSGYATGGMELWSQEVPGATALVAPGAGGSLSVVTEGGELVGLDTETGNEWYRTERPHSDVSGLSAAVGGHGRIAVAAWSFLTVLDHRGDVVFDRSFDGVVESLGLTPTQVVVTLKNGRSVGVDPETGEELWERDRDATAVAPVGDDAVLALTSDGVDAVEADGSYDPRDIAAGEGVAATVDGAVVCVSTAGSVTVYRVDTDPLAAVTATVRPDRVQHGESLRVAVENDGDRDASFDLAVEVDGDAIVDTAPEYVEVDAGSHAEVAFRVTDVRQTADTAVTVTADGEPLTTATVRVEQAPDATDVVRTTGRLDALEGDTLRWEGGVENTGDAPVELTRDGETTSLDPGEAVAATYESAYEPDTTVERTVTVATGTDSERVSLSVTAPVEPLSVAVEAVESGSHPYVDVELHNGLDVPVTDEVAVSIGSRPERRRSHELAPGATTVIAVPLTDPPDGPFEVTVECAGTGVVERRELPAVTAPTSARDRTSREPDRSREQRRETDARASAHDDTDPATGSGPGTDHRNESHGPSSATGQSETPDHPRSEERSRGGEQRRGEEQPREPDQSQVVEDVTTDRDDESRAGGPGNVAASPSVTVDRDLTDTVMVGLKVREAVTVAAADERVPEATVALGETTEEVGPLGSATLERHHVFYETGTRTVSGGSVRTPDGETPVPDGHIDVEAGPLIPRFLVERDYDRATLRFELVNASGRPCTVSMLGLESHGSWLRFDIDEGHVADGETLSLERPVDPDRLDDRRVIDAGLRYRLGDAEEQSRVSLAAVRETTGQGFSYEVVDVSGVTTTARGTVTLEIANRTDTRASNVTVAASGTPVDENPLYAPSRIDAIGDGETAVVEFDVDPDESRELALDISVTGRVDGSSVEDAARVSGPVPTDADGWSEDLLEQWTLDDGTDESVDWPSHLETGYDRTE